MANLHGINLNHLVALHALLEERSVTRAARRVGITQSSLSGTLAKLRQAFGDELLIRVGHGMVPTPRAEALLPRLRAAVAAVGEVVEDPGPFDPATCRDRFVVVMSDLVEIVLLPSLAAKLVALAPHAALQVRPGGLSLPGDALSSGGVDLHIGLFDPSQLPADHHVAPVFDSRLIGVVREGHPEIGDAPDLETYVRQSHVVVTHTLDATGVVDDQLAALGASRHVALRVPDFLMVPALLAETDFVAALDRPIATWAARYMPLRSFELPVSTTSITLRMAWHARTHRDPARRWLRGLVRQAARQG